MADKNRRIITFTSDYGLSEEWVAVCKSVIYDIAPSIKIIDITHCVPSFDVSKGALVLASALSYLPKGIHLSIVDPGVGTDRKGIIIKTKGGNYFVGPDNGLLIPAVKKDGGVEKAHEISNPDFMLSPVSPTFHGRDIFSPAAAHLAKGVSIQSFGREIKAKTLFYAPWHEARVIEGKIQGDVIDIDKYGTIRLNISWPEMKKIHLNYGDNIVFKSVVESVIPLKETFAEVDKGKPLLTVDSSEYLALAVNRGSAFSMFGLDVGEKVTISRIED